LALIDAKASALDQDFAAGLARLTPLLASGGASREAFRLAGECNFQLQDYDKAMQVLHHAMSSEKKFEEPTVYIRLGSVLLVKKRWKQARDAFLRSIQYRPTAEAWSGVAYAEYRSDELQMCYEALCEANLLDNERADVWAQLALVHLRLENWEAAGKCTRLCLDHGPDCDELLLEVTAEYTRRERQPALAEAAARRALEVRDSGQGHSVLADSLAYQGQAEKAVLEYQVAVKLLADQPDLRRGVFERAVAIAKDLNDPPLMESLLAVQKLADEEYERMTRAHSSD
jgi:tetratricopeptide (TPR) repeat protein